MFTYTPRPLRQHSTPWSVRREEANILNSTLLMIEIVLAGELQRFAYKSVERMKEHGIFRQRLKQSGNEMLLTANDLQQRCNHTDRNELMLYVTEAEPFFRQAYMDEGAGITSRLQSLFANSSGDITNRIFLASKNMLDRCNTAHSEVLANVMVVVAIAQTGIEAYEIIKKRQDALIAGDGRIRRCKSAHHEKMLCCARTIINLMMRDSKYLPEKEAMQARELVRQMQLFISGAGMGKVCEAAIGGGVVEYIEYVIASLVAMIHQGISVPEEVEQRMLHRLGSEKAVDMFKEELRVMPLPCHPCDVDIWEFAQQLPVGSEDSMLTSFRRMCAASQYMKPE